MPGNRRIGERVTITPVAVAWMPAITENRRGRRGRRRSPQPAYLVELSVSGARIVAHSRSRIEVGTWMELDVQGHHGVVEVRRIEDTDNRSAFVFGVVFILLAPELQQRIYRTIALSRSRRR